MKRRTIKLWTGFGAYLLASASAAALTAGTPAPPSSDDDARSAEAARVFVADSHRGGEGGEKGQGGEGGERGAFGGLSENVELAARLFAMKGHLRAGSDLLAAGHLENAAMHFAHPLSEEYEQAAPILRARGIASFEDALRTLVDRAGTKDRAKTRTALDQANAALDRALAATLGKAGADSALPKAIIALLRKAAHEYAESIEDGRITDKEEYQDARGFVLVARAAVADAGETLRKRGAEPYRELAAHLDTLARILEPPVPPEAAKAPASEVYATVARVEFALAKLR